MVLPLILVKKFYFILFLKESRARYSFIDMYSTQKLMTIGPNIPLWLQLSLSLPPSFLLMLDRHPLSPPLLLLPCQVATKMGQMAPSSPTNPILCKVTSPGLLILTYLSLPSYFLGPHFHLLPLSISLGSLSFIFLLNVSPSPDLLSHRALFHSLFPSHTSLHLLQVVILFGLDKWPVS